MNKLAIATALATTLLASHAMAQSLSIGANVGAGAAVPPARVEAGTRTAVDVGADTKVPLDTKAGADAKADVDTKAAADAKGSADTKAATKVNQRTQARGKSTTPAAKMGAGAEVQGSGSAPTR